MDTQAVMVADHSLDTAITSWLMDKALRSGSEHTLRAYCTTLAAFRGQLAAQGADLDGDPVAVGLVAQAWAAQRASNATRRGGIAVKGSTYNHRLTVLSSFYTFAQRRGLGRITSNPITALDKHSEADSQHAKVLDSRATAALLGRIDRATVQGLRDYALLSVALYTGRRAAELAGLRCGDVECLQAVTLRFRRTKGGKVMDDELPAKTGGALLKYIHTVHGADLSGLPADAPLWLSLAHNQSAGRAITTQAIADICLKHLGVSTVHSTRHTWAKTMDDLGAPVTVIQRRLGHANIATTQRYLHGLPQPVNPFAEQMERALGIE